MPLSKETVAKLLRLAIDRYDAGKPLLPLLSSRPLSLDGQKLLDEAVARAKARRKDFGKS